MQLVQFKRHIDRGYRHRGSKGQKLRAKRLQSNPLCQDCEAKGVITVAVEVDHIQPLSLGGTDTDDNTRNLCKPCHLKRTAEQFGYRKSVSIGLDGWPIDE